MRLTYRQAKALGIKIPGKQDKKKPPQITTLAVWDAKVTDGNTLIVMPSIPPSLNVWKNWHWSKQNAYKIQMYNDFSYLRLLFGIPVYLKCKVTVTYYFPDNRRRDIHDNYAPKFLNDALVNAGILTDDNSQLIHVELSQDYDNIRPRTEIFISEVE